MCCGVFFQNRLFSVVSFPPLSLPQKRTVELSVQCVQRSASVCTYPYLSRSPWALPSAPLQVFSKCSHRVMLEKNTETQHLATAQLFLFTRNHPPSRLVAGEASPGATAPGTRQSGRGEHPPCRDSSHGTGSPCTPTGHCYHSKSSSLLLVLRARFSNFHSISVGAG